MPLLHWERSSIRTIKNCNQAEYLPLGFMDKHRQLLIVADHKDLREAMCGLFRLNGYSIR
jgi:hypothetical protein